MTWCSEDSVVLCGHRIHGLGSPEGTGLEQRCAWLSAYSIPHELSLGLSLLVTADDLEVLQAMSQLLTS